MSRILSAALVAAAASASISGMVAEGPLQGTQAEPAATATAALAAAPTTASFSQARADSSSSTRMRRELLVNGGITNVGCTDDDTYTPIYAKELADQMKRKSNLASSLTFFPLRHGAESSRAGDHHDSKRDGQRGSPGLASSKESDDGQPKNSHAEQHQLRNGASIREASLVERSRAARRRLALTRPGSSSHVIGGKPRLPAKAKARSSASEGGFKVLDNSVERAAQMMEGNTASATASDRGADNMLDQRLERLEARFESLEGKIDRLIATRLPDWYGGGAAAAAPAPGAPFSFVSLLTPKSAAATSEKRLDA